MTARKVKPTIVTAQHTSADERAHLHAAMDKAMDEQPPARPIFDFVIAFCCGYGIGWAAATLISYVALAALMLSGSAFLATCVAVVGWAIAIYAFFTNTNNIMVGTNIVITNANAALDVVSHGVSSAKTRVVGWFSSSKPAPVAA